MPPNEATFPLDWAPDAVIVADASGRIVHANTRAAELFGYRHEDLPGQPLEHLIPEGLGGPDVPAGEEPVEGRSVACMRRDGSAFPALASARSASDGAREYRVIALRGASGSDTGASAAPRGVSALQQRDFFSLFNHDVRQSLQSIQFLCDSLTSAAPETAAIISEIIGSVKKLLDTVQRLSEASPLAAAEERCVLGDLLQALGRELQPVAQRKGLDLVVADAPQEIRTDPVLLRELLQNLIANAIRYTQQGRVEVRCLTVGEGVRIDIVDTGIGMDADQLAALFRSAPSVPTPQRRGRSGLGLTIARQLADVLGCRIDVTSTPGEGSCFTVTAPRSGPRLAPLAVPGSGSPGSNAQRG